MPEHMGSAPFAIEFMFVDHYRKDCDDINWLVKCK